MKASQTWRLATLAEVREAISRVNEDSPLYGASIVPFIGCDSYTIELVPDADQDAAALALQELMLVCIS